MSFYQTHLLPHLINLVMQDKLKTQERAVLIPQASGVVLEIGFGSGLNLLFYQPNIIKFYALDVSQELWQLAAEQIKHAPFPVQFLHASAETIPLKNYSVNTVVTTWTLCSIPHPEQALQEIKRVLTPNGKLLFIEHGLSTEKKVAQWQTKLNPIWKTVAGGCNLNRNIADLIHQAGFKMCTLEQGYRNTHKTKLLRYYYKGIASIR